MVRDLQTGELQGEFLAESALIQIVRHSPDGKRIVTGGADRKARLWDPEAGDMLLNLKGHTDFIMSAEFSPHSHRLVTGSPDGTVRLWDATPQAP